MGISITAFVLLFFTSLINIAHAQTFGTSLIIDPSYHDVTVLRGIEYTFLIYIKNNGNQALFLTVKSVNFSDADTEGGMIFNTLDSTDRAHGWFSMTPENFTLASGEFKKIKVQLTIPDDASPGGHYASILFEPILPDYYFVPGEPRVVSTVGALFLMNVLTLNQDSDDAPFKIADLKLSPDSIHDDWQKNLNSVVKNSILKTVYAADVELISLSPLDFIVSITNDSIVHEKPKGTLVIKNMFGRTTETITLPERNILPGRSRDYSLTLVLPKRRWLPDSLAQQLLFGKYTALFLLEDGVSGYLQKSIIFWAMPWRLIVVVFMLILAIIVTINVRKRIVRSFSTLFKRG